MASETEIAAMPPTNAQVFHGSMNPKANPHSAMRPTKRANETRKTNTFMRPLYRRATPRAEQVGDDARDLGAQVENREGSAARGASSGVAVDPGGAAATGAGSPASRRVPSRAPRMPASASPRPRGREPRVA